MILEVFGVLTALSVIMIFIGSLKNVDNPAFKTLGFFFLFLLSFVFINENLEYQNGTESIKDCNCTEYRGALGINETVTYIYATYSGTDTHSKTIGIFMALGSAAGMILSFIDGTKKGFI